MISLDSYYVLKYFSTINFIPQDELPEWFRKDFSRIKLLVKEDYLEEILLCPSNKEKEHPYGLFAYQISAKGTDAILEFEKHSNDVSKNRTAKQRDRIFQVFLVLLGAVLTLLAEHFSDVCTFLAEHLFG